MPIYLGQGGINRQLKDIYIGSGGVNRKQKDIYLGNGGVNRKIFTSPPATPFTLVWEGSDAINNTSFYLDFNNPYDEGIKIRLHREGLKYTDYKWKDTVQVDPNIITKVEMFFSTERISLPLPFDKILRISIELVNHSNYWRIYYPYSDPNIYPRKIELPLNLSGQVAYRCSDIQAVPRDGSVDI